MANTATTATVVDQSTDAAFRTWIAEVITTLGTTLTLTQTADTGQINTGTVTRPVVINTAAGYTIWRFNDTLQATSPVFIKLEFGVGSTQPTNPQMWITIGTGSNGAGTLTGVVGSRSTVTAGSPISSTVTSYTSRFVYNATYGFLAMAWKLNGYGTATSCMGGFVVMRSNDTTGAATGDAVMLITNQINATTGTSSSTGQMQCLSYLTSTLYPPTIANGTYWTPYAITSAPFGLTSTAFGGNAQTFPALYMTPVISFSNFVTVGRAAEEPIGSTFSETVIGSTALTYLSVGQPFGSSYIGSFSDAAQTLNILWQ